jgi:hypothetical protein
VKRPSMYHHACAEVDLRSGGLCEANVTDVCLDGPHRGDHHHHIVLRSRGGKDAAMNLLHVCNAAHTFIHANPARATELGLMRSRWAS